MPVEQVLTREETLKSDCGGERRSWALPGCATGGQGLQGNRNAGKTWAGFRPVPFAQRNRLLCLTRPAVAWPCPPLGLISNTRSPDSSPSTNPSAFYCLGSWHLFCFSRLATPSPNSPHLPKGDGEYSTRQFSRDLPAAAVSSLWP